MHRKFPGVAGRVDDFVVGLQAGATHTLRLGLDNFWCPVTKETQVNLTNGQYRLTAQFVGRGAEHLNIAAAGMRFMNFWRGRLQSNPVELDVGERPGG